MNLALLVMFWLGTQRQTELRNHDLDLYFAHQKETAALLSRCVVPSKQP
jgi:hypothetical protein